MTLQAVTICLSTEILGDSFHTINLNRYRRDQSLQTIFSEEDRVQREDFWFSILFVVTEFRLRRGVEGRERKKHQFVVPLIYTFIPCMYPDQRSSPPLEHIWVMFQCFSTFYTVHLRAEARTWHWLWNPLWFSVVGAREPIHFGGFHVNIHNYITITLSAK